MRVKAPLRSQRRAANNSCKQFLQTEWLFWGGNPCHQRMPQCCHNSSLTNQSPSLHTLPLPSNSSPLTRATHCCTIHTLLALLTSGGPHLQWIFLHIDCHMTFRMAQAAKKIIDIGANLTDEMYQGIYHGSKKHEADLSHVLKRAWDAGLSKMIITGTSLTDSKAALELAKTNERLYCTVGCHPTRCGEFEAEGTSPETYLENLLQLALDNRENVVAIGECGLDYDRTQFCSPEIQRKYFEKQISLAEVTGLPMFLHCRNAAADLVKILTDHREKITGGVVHSFDGTKEELNQILDLDLFIGLNGCSLKTEDNLAVAALVPTQRLMIETDSPWCEIRPSHAGHKHVKTVFPTKKKEKWESGVMVKSRNEPSCIVQILEVLAAIKKEDSTELAEQLYSNTMKLFFPSEAE